MITLKDVAVDKIEAAFSDGEVAYIHAHNAAHGCFAADIRRGA